jgi:hypothetical protein
MKGRPLKFWDSSAVVPMLLREPASALILGI